MVGKREGDGFGIGCFQFGCNFRVEILSTTWRLSVVLRFYGSTVLRRGGSFYVSVDLCFYGVGGSENVEAWSQDLNENKEELIGKNRKL